MISLIALLAAVAVDQGDALRLRVPDRPGLEAVTIEWQETARPFVADGEGWWTMIGIDLDTAAGSYEATIRYRFADGRSETEAAPIAVRPVEFPTTELTVESRYVELSPENQQRAAAEAEETRALYATLTESAFWSEAFIVPVEGVTGGRNFGHRRVFNGQPRAPHSGADLRAGTGTPIRAANRGRVVLAKELFFSGNAVFIDHGLGVYTVYLHLSEIGVNVGQLLERGQIVGLAGATGRVTGPHLHWGVRVLEARIDPFSLLDLNLD